MPKCLIYFLMLRVMANNLSIQCTSQNWKNRFIIHNKTDYQSLDQHKIFLYQAGSTLFVLQTSSAVSFFYSVWDRSSATIYVQAIPKRCLETGNFNKMSVSRDGDGIKTDYNFLVSHRRLIRIVVIFFLYLW